MTFEDFFGMAAIPSEMVMSPMPSPKEWDAEALQKLMDSDEKAKIGISFYQAVGEVGDLITAMDGMRTRVSADLYVQNSGYAEMKLTTTGLGKALFLPYRHAVGNMFMPEVESAVNMQLGMDS
jgi:hypothetical protein